MTRTVVLGLLLFTAAALAQPVAITRVTVIDVAGGPSRPDMTVLIDGERIAAVGPGSEVAVPGKVQVVEGAGKFLIPGLWDMHAHWGPGYAFTAAPYLPLFTANGITGIRMMAGHPTYLQWRQQSTEGMLAGPRMVLAGVIVDGPKPFWRDSIATNTPDDGRQAVQRTQQDGYDFVKVYSSLSRAVFFAIADEAKRRRIPFAGHVPDAVRFEEASDAGQKSIEHLTGLLLAVSSQETELRREFADAATLPATPERAALQRSLGVRLLETHDAARAAALFARLKANGTWQVPTFPVLRLLEPEHAMDPRLKYLPAPVRAGWARASRAREQRAPADIAHQRNVFQRRLELVGEMHRAGVGILAGSDSQNPSSFPGFSLHEDLEWLVKAGLSPLAALQAATRNPAIYLDRLRDFGTVEKGKMADLVLLDADPTQDIRATRRIVAVVAAGKLHSRADLDRMLADIERLASAN
jgi:imidazolonepropionase-like amidohydrolase